LLEDLDNHDAHRYGVAYVTVDPITGRVKNTKL